jgi:5,5'-dehydrodivanillate O-demethylase
VLAGDLWLDDVDVPTDWINLEDYVVQVGQGRVADRGRERLGPSDRGVILLRKIWERELRALAEGRTLKEWSRPARLVATSGV